MIEKRLRFVASALRWLMDALSLGRHQRRPHYRVARWVDPQLRPFLELQYEALKERNLMAKAERLDGRDRPLIRESRIEAHGYRRPPDRSPVVPTSSFE